MNTKLKTEINQLNITRRDQLAITESVEILLSKGKEINIMNFGDVIHLCDAFDPLDKDTHAKLSSLGTQWREQSETYSYYVND